MEADERYRALADLVGAENVLRNEPMARHTTFQIGGPAELFVRPQSPEQVADVVRYCHEQGICLRAIGRGSDLLVADRGLRGVVMQIADNLAHIRILPDAVIYAEAGATNEEVSTAALGAGLSGYEFACGIPGTVGGAAIMNAGAYDGEFAQVATSLRCVTPEGELVDVSAAQADWSYRHSMMDERGYLVVAATLQLAPDDPEEIRARVDDLTRRRAEKQPLEMPSAGSTFKRPTGHYAGKLIQDAGLQGLRVGGAEVSRKHAGFLVNADHATAADVRGLIRAVQERVRADSGVELQPEVRMWGFDDGE